MNQVAQIAHPAPGGASDVCATLAIAGIHAGVAQDVLFWGNEPAWSPRVGRCEKGGVAVSELLKKKGLAPTAHRPVYAWARARRQATGFILHYPPSLFAVRAALRGPRRPPLIVVEHHSNSAKNSRKWLTTLLIQWLADGVVYLTPEYQSEVAARLGRLFRPGKTRIIANGLDLTPYPLAEPCAATDGGPFILGMSARLVPRKDHPTLLRAFAQCVARLPEVNLRLELAGDGPLLSEARALTAQLGLTGRVHFLGMLRHRELLERLRQWQICILATLGETQSISIMEALACGLPILASRAPGVTNQIQDGVTGLLTPMEDVNAMADQLVHLVQDTPLRLRLATNARAQATTHFSATTMWQNYWTFLQDLTPSALHFNRS